MVNDSAKGSGAAAEGDNNQSPSVPKRQKDSVIQASANQQPIVQQVSNQKRQRLELLTQIKYTLIYDERIDKPVVDKILADYDKKLKQQALNQDQQPDETNVAAAQEGGTGQTVSEFTPSGNDREGA